MILANGLPSTPRGISQVVKKGAAMVIPHPGVQEQVPGGALATSWRRPIWNIWKLLKNLVQRTTVDWSGRGKRIYRFPP